MNKCVFSLARKLRRDVDDRMERDSLFQKSGAAREKDGSPHFFLYSAGPVIGPPGAVAP